MEPQGESKDYAKEICTDYPLLSRNPPQQHLLQKGCFKGEERWGGECIIHQPSASLAKAGSLFC